jgi:hypothetical protein
VGRQRGSSEFDCVPVLAAVKPWAESSAWVMGLTAAALRQAWLGMEEPRGVSFPVDAKGLAPAEVLTGRADNAAVAGQAAAVSSWFPVCQARFSS